MNKEKIYLWIAIAVSILFFFSGYSHEVSSDFSRALFSGYGSFTYWSFFVGMQAFPFLAYREWRDISREMKDENNKELKDSAKRN